MYFHTNIVVPPTSIPATAPYLLARFQNKESKTTGPKVAPNPAQANDTISNTELLGFDAITTPIIEMIITVTRATMSDAFFCKVYKSKTFLEQVL